MAVGTTPMYQRDWDELSGTTWLDYEGNPTGFETDTSNTGYLADAFGQGTNDPLEQFGANNVVGAEQFGANPWHGQMQNNLNPVNDPIMGTAGYINPGGASAYHPYGHQILANNMAQDVQNQIAYEMEMRRRAQAQKDLLNLELEKARIAAESRRYAMDKWAEAWEGGGTSAVDFDYPEGFFNERGKQYATTKGDYNTDIPRMLPDVPTIARGDVDQQVMGAGGIGDILNPIFAQGRGGGLDVGRGKLGEELGKKQAELVAGQQGAEAQQGVANSRWIQDLRDAIAKVEGRVQQQGLNEMNLKSQTMPATSGGYQNLLTG